MAAAAAQEGLIYAPDKISSQPNTTDAHRLIRWAAEIGKAAEMEQRLMDLYFAEGADLNNKSVRVQAAADVGLDPKEVRAALDSDKDVEEVTRRNPPRRLASKACPVSSSAGVLPSRVRSHRNISPK